MSELVFSEVVEYFRSFQGEVPYVGLSGLFIRFKACNLVKICKFCDTREIMLHGPSMMIPFKSVTQTLDHENIQSLTFTGGEPTLPKYREQIHEFLHYCLENSVHTLKRKILIETNGFGMIDFIKEMSDEEKQIKTLMIVWSPKFLNKDLLDDNIAKYQQLKDLGFERFLIKPVFNEAMLPFIETFISLLDEYDKVTKVYLMPEGTTPEKLLESSRKTCEFAIEHKVNLSPRLQVSYDFI